MLLLLFYSAHSILGYILFIVVLANTTTITAATSNFITAQSTAACATNVVDKALIYHFTFNKKNLDHKLSLIRHFIKVQMHDFLLPPPLHHPTTPLVFILPPLECCYFFSYTPILTFYKTSYFILTKVPNS